MEVLVGPTCSIDVSAAASPVYGRDHRSPEKDEHVLVQPCLFFDVSGGRQSNNGSGYGMGGPIKLSDDESSESSSSIGVPGDSDDESLSKGGAGEEEEVQSKLNRGGLGSLGSLEDSLPIKRGLSNYFCGKSKSFADLSKVSKMKELEKQEKPLNKRRRILIQSKLSRNSSFYSWSNPKSMPLLPLDEDEDDDDQDGEDDYQVEKAKQDPSSPSSTSSTLTEEKKEDETKVKKMRLRLRSFKTRSCFSLTNLQEHDEEEEEFGCH
ncbi:Stress response NST1-like protein [Quillaja saponaria]|uniref:Stress response NST1-like protein n=1 Tax=Quillaja saponaria TaxID=32244 RepID=A0AAD7PS08_QUISA|nr:Stress response NST1-like protein [Quillaja saponaria]